MAEKYTGLDQLPLNENGFELFKDGKPFLSLYHDCKLLECHLPESGDFSLKLRKVASSGYGPEKGSLNELLLKNASIVEVYGEGDGNFEDINELTLLEESSSWLKLRLAIGPVQMTLKVQQIVLSTDIK